MRAGAGDLLRRRVVGRADEHSRHPGRSRSVVLVMPKSTRYACRGTDVIDTSTFAGADVTMHRTTLVGEVEGPADLVEQIEGVGVGECRPVGSAQQLGEADPVDELGDEVHRVADLTPGVDAGDVRVSLEPGRHRRFVEESLAHRGVAGVAAGEHLEARPAARRRCPSRRTRSYRARGGSSARAGTGRPAARVPARLTPAPWSPGRVIRAPVRSVR